MYECMYVYKSVRVIKRVSSSIVPPGRLEIQIYLITLNTWNTVEIFNNILIWIPKLVFEWEAVCPWHECKVLPNHESITVCNIVNSYSRSQNVMLCRVLYIYNCRIRLFSIPVHIWGWHIFSIYSFQVKSLLNVSVY